MPREVYEAWDARAAGAAAESAWNERLAQYQRKFPELAAPVSRRMAGEPPCGLG